MKKLLLLTVSLLSFALNHFAATLQVNDTIINRIAAEDSVIAIIKSNPRSGFKDLFDASSLAPGISSAHLNPQAIHFVQGYLQQHGKNLNKMKSWGKPYFDMMDNILTHHGLPSELKYLSVIESDLKSYAVSWAGAVGPWQFMPETARNLGLRVSHFADERTDFYKSTHAAARYLTDLYGLYGDWLLVIAAYNGGPGNVNSAIKKSKSHNFWDLQYYLPEESRNHVKKFIATHYIMEGEGGITTLGKNETRNLLLSNRDSVSNAAVSSVELSGGSKYNSVVIANYIKMDIAEFNRLNPNFDKLLARTDAGKSVLLYIPTDKLLLFQSNKMQILEQSMRMLLSMAN